MSVMYRVKNRGASTVVYKIPDKGIRREFKPGQIMPISSEELEELTFQPGGTLILSQFLQILDLDGLNAVHIKTEPEYHMSEQDIARLITSGSLDAFLDCLDFAPISVIDLIKKLAIDIPMVDMQKRKALKEKTGFDVSVALAHIEAEKKDAGAEATEAAPAATSGRRTTTNYKVVTKEKTDK